MREIEIKAHIFDSASCKAEIEKFAGIGKGNIKKDTYLTNESGKLLRIRNNNGKLEITTKKSCKNAIGDENNLEFEIKLDSASFDDALAFFNALGFEFYFNKYKRGFDWEYNGVHIELLEVNNLGWFLEMEVLLDIKEKADRINDEKEKLHLLLSRLGIDEKNIEPKSYRAMILGE